MGSRQQRSDVFWYLEAPGGPTRWARGSGCTGSAHTGMNRAPWLHLNTIPCMWVLLNWEYFRFLFHDISSAARGLQPGSTNPSLELASHFPGSHRTDPFVCSFSCAAWMLPLMCFFVCFFPLLKGELAQTSLGVLTGFNEQLLSGTRTSTNCAVHWGGGVAGYPSVLRLWLLISSSLCSRSAQKSNYFDF